MFDFDELRVRTQRILGTDQPLIVSVLGLPADLVGDLTALVVAGTIGDDLGAGALTEGILGAAGMRVSREVNARSQGVSARMVVAVSPTAIHLLSLPPTGAHPGKEVLRFCRATTTVTVKRKGLSRRLSLTDSDNGQRVRLTGGIAPWSRYAVGTKEIIDELTR